MIETSVFVNGKFNTCWKVWVLMLEARSEVVNFFPSLSNGAIITAQQSALDRRAMIGNFRPARYANLLWMTSRSCKKAAITAFFLDRSLVVVHCDRS